MSITPITSKDNPRVKQLIKWQKPRDRKKDVVVLVEGVREVKMALKGDFEPLALWICPELIQPEAQKMLLTLKTPVFEVDRAIYSKIAYRESTEGFIGVFKEKMWPSDLGLDQEVFKVLVLENIEKPGNLGAVLRTANAQGLHAIICTENSVDVYHPNVIRSSLGAVFKTPVYRMSNSQARQWLQDRKVQIYASSVDFSASIHQTVFPNKCAVVLGNEATGISDFWLQNAPKKLIIPMQGDVSSLNVSVAAAIFAYEMAKPHI